MKIKTDDLIGRPLDYAVAIALGGTDLRFDTVATWWITIDGKDRSLSNGWSAAQNFSPSTDWAQGGPIIERERMQIDCFPLEKYASKENVSSKGVGNPFHGCGPTPLIAAMRCYVASKLGDEVEVPDALLREL